jgi:hypothetical protein
MSRTSAVHRFPHKVCEGDAANDDVLLLELSLSKDVTATSVSVEPHHGIGTVSSNRFLIASPVHTV